MQFDYRMNYRTAVHGLAEGEPLTRGLMLPYLQQITPFTIADSEAGDLVLTATDVRTGQEFPLTVAISGAVEATSLDEIVAAVAASATWNALFTATEDGATVFTLTARASNRAFTFTATPPGSMTVTVGSNTQDAGGDKIDFGFVARDASNYLVAVGASTELADLVGALRRSEANQWRDTFEGAEVGLARGMKHPVIYDTNGGGIWLTYAGTAPTLEGDLYLRRAQTSGAGTVGELLAAPAGGQEVWTLTPTASEDSFAVQFPYGGQVYTLIADGADGTYSATEICDDLRASATAQDIAAATGLAFGGTDTLTIATPAGTALDSDPVSIGQGAFASITETTPADVDAIDISSIARVDKVDTSESLARVRIHVMP